MAKQETLADKLMIVRKGSINPNGWHKRIIVQCEDCSIVFCLVHYYDSSCPGKDPDSAPDDCNSKHFDDIPPEDYELYRRIPKTHIYVRSKPKQAHWGKQ